MATVAVQPPARKPRAYYAHLFEQSGALVHINAIITFVGDDGEIVEVEPSMITFLVVLGEMTLADAQRIADLMAGGAAAIACSRQMEVQ